MTTPTGGVYGIPPQFRLGRARKHLYPLRPTRPQARLHRPLSGGVFLCDWEYPCRTRTILYKLFLHRFDMPGTDRSFTGRTDARPPVADGEIHTGTSGRRGKICGKVIPPHGNHPSTDKGAQRKMQTDTMKGKDAPSPFPIQKIYFSTLSALFPLAASGATDQFTAAYSGLRIEITGCHIIQHAAIQLTYFRFVVHRLKIRHAH